MNEKRMRLVAAFVKLQMLLFLSVTGLFVSFAVLWQPAWFICISWFAILIPIIVYDVQKLMKLLGPIK